MKLAFMYAGQGSQCVGMGKELYENNATFARVIDAADPGFDIKAMMFDTPIEILSQTQNTQPCLAAFAAGVTEVLYENGIRPEIAAGLSLGEYSALYAAGVFSLEQVIATTAFRGKAMQKSAEGKECIMSAVMGLDAKPLREVVAQAASEGMVEITNYNAKGQIVIAGDEPAVRKAEALAKEAGAKRCMQLKVSSAFHTSYMEPASVELKAYLDEVSYGQMQFPVVFNYTARPLEEGQSITDLLECQIKNGVRMQETIEYLADQGVDTVIEIGPGKVLSGFIKRTVSGITSYAIEDVASLEKAIAAIKEQM